MHDLLVSRSGGSGGVALPASHGLRAAVERHRARLGAELTRARVRRRCASLEALRAQIEAEAARAQGGTPHPRWVRVNTARTTVDAQLDGTFAGYEVVAGLAEVLTMSAGPGPAGQKKVLCLDGHVPNLLALPPGADVTATEAYRRGDIILQDKASCFPAYLLDPRGDDGDVVDACAAPGNKSTHLAAILAERGVGIGARDPRIHAFEKDKARAKTLARMVQVAGCERRIVVHQGADFLRVDPRADEYRRVGALLLDPSCSGSGIIGRDDVPELHLPEAAVSSAGATTRTTTTTTTTATRKKKVKVDRKRKRDDDGDDDNGRRPSDAVMVDDDGATTVVGSEKDLAARIEALAAFQLTLVLHAFSFPAARKITYSTCSVHAGENEHVVSKALTSDIARERGWRILARERQVRGMREWPVRGDVDACSGDSELAEACIRTYRDDGRGVMGFFVAAFVRDDDTSKKDDDDEGRFVRDENGRIVRDENGIPTLKATGKKAIDLDALGDDDDDSGESIEYYVGDGGTGMGTDDGDGPFVRDAEGRIVRDAMGVPTLKEDKGDEWAGFDD